MDNKDGINHKDEINIGLDSLPESFRSIAEGLDLEALQNLKNSIDREAVLREAAGMLEQLKGFLSPDEQQSLDSLMGCIFSKDKEE